MFRAMQLPIHFLLAAFSCSADFHGFSLLHFFIFFTRLLFSLDDALVLLVAHFDMK